MSHSSFVHVRNYCRNCCVSTSFGFSSISRFQSSAFHLRFCMRVMWSFRSLSTFTLSHSIVLSSVTATNHTSKHTMKQKLPTNMKTACVARWPSGQGAGLAINRSRVRIPVAALPSATLGKLFTHMCLCHQAV